MKKNILITALLLLVTASFASVQTTDFAEAKKLALETGKPILIDFMTDW